VTENGNRRSRLRGGADNAVRFDEQLLEVAAEVCGATGDTDAAGWATTITIAAAACDVAAGRALTSLRHADQASPTSRLSASELRRLDALLESRKLVTLRPKNQRALWRSLTGDKLSSWPGWIRYLRHLDRRDALTHRGRLRGGQTLTRAEATEALDITRAFRDHIDTVMRAGRGT
jgi:hypothetical protein